MKPPYQKILLTFLILSFSAHLSAQNTDCWKCLAAAANQNEALSICQNLNQSKITKDEKIVINYVIGKLNLIDGKYDEAIQNFTLAEKSEDNLMKSLVLGLKGDCYSELGKYQEAVDCYKHATDLSQHEFFTPYFLNKEGLIYSKQENKEELKRITSRLWVNHRNFALSRGFSKYYVYTPSSLDSIQRKLSEKALPAGPYGIGLFNGEQVSEAYLNTYIKRRTEQSQLDSGYGIEKASEDVILSSAWQDAITQLWLDSKKNSFALNISPDNFHAYLFGESGYPLMDDIKQNFTDADGVFNKENFEAFLKNKENPETKTELDQWNEIKEQLQTSMQAERYKYLENTGIFVTTLEAQRNIDLQSQEVTIQVVELGTRMLEDSLFSYNDRDLQNYFNNHKFDADYEYPAVKILQTLSLPVTLSSEDSLAFLKEMEALKADFEKTRNDSTFMVQHGGYYFAGNLSTVLPESHPKAEFQLNYPDEMNSLFQSAKKGSVIGPYLHNDVYCIAKVVGFNEKQMTARHILIGSSKYDSEEKQAAQLRKAEELLKKVNHENFGSYVVQYSEDGGSTEKGGVYEDFFNYEMVKPFADFAEFEPIGKIGMVKTEFGYHIMEVLERKKVRYPMLHIVTKKLTPTASDRKRTEEKLVALSKKVVPAMQKVAVHQKTNFINNAAAELGINSSPEFRIRIIINENFPMSDYGTGQYQEQIFGFAYNPSVKPYDIGPVLTEETRITLPVFIGSYSGKVGDFDQAADMIERNYLSEQKTDSLQKLGAQYASLEELAAAAKTEVITAAVSRNSMSIPSVGYYPDFINHLFEKTNPSGQILIRSTPRSCFVYTVSGYRTIDPGITLNESRVEIEQSLTEHFSNYPIAQSADKPTVFNYTLLKLGLRK